MNICQWESCVESGCHGLLTVDQNKNTSTIQSVVCNCFNSTKRSFYVNMWQWRKHGYHFILGLNRQSAEWRAAGKSCPKMKTSAGKVLATVFWDAQGILFIDYLEKGRTINSEYHMALLVHLKEEITKKMATNKEEKSALSPRQCTMSKVDCNDGKNYMNCTSNCFCTHPNLQIWPSATTGCLQTSKEWSRERDLASVRSDIRNWSVFWGQRQIIL